MLNEITRLQSHSELSTVEASEILLAWAMRHTDMLDNLLRIKAAAPQDNEQSGFRRQRPGSVSLEQLRQILQELIDALIVLSREQGDNTAPLFMTIQQAEVKLKALYEGQSTAFAVILNELIELENAVMQKFPAITKNVIAEPIKLTTVASAEPAVTLVYVRVFHKQLPQLIMPEADKSWLKTVLESVREAEKHGLAVYANEAEAKRSLRGENYGYVTVAITPEQDITHQRRVKQDPQLLCPILTIAPIGLEQLKKLTYAETDYIIQEGMIRKA